MIQIRSPFNGAVLNHLSGKQDANGLSIVVKGIAPMGTEVTVNGVPARRKGEYFDAPLTITQFETAITATVKGIQGEASHTVRVLWDKNSRRRYRIAIDDNVFFLRDLCQKRPANIFDNLYLSILKKVHDEYGTKYSLNCFYESPEKDFNLSMLPDTWKSQFADNADWLKMTWHAYNEFPDRPYQYATPEEILKDLDLIHDEVCRFAGEASWAAPSIVHWGEIQPSTFKALYSRGVRVLSGYFTPYEQHHLVAFGLSDYFCDTIDNRRLLMDWESGIVFSRLTAVINLTPLNDLVPIMKKDMEDPETAEILDFLTHEQYFWPFYFNYIPEHAKRLETVARFAAENGYEPVFYHEGFLGIPRD